jgi:dCTP deaminase
VIKSDRWIRRMALEKGMIKPFEDRQVRKGISFGLSSYGYDIRIADEFKIFTNINTTIVDPKGFDPRSFVDYQGEVAVIPPNSFAWDARWNTSRSRGTCSRSAWASPPTRGAASSRT